MTDDKCFQGDILEMAGALSGSIYRPGKMFIARNEDASIVDRDGWNTMVIRAAGDQLQVSLNGKKIAEARDALAAWGRIGFQVHGGEFDKMRIRVKEAVLSKIPAAK